MKTPHRTNRLLQLFVTAMAVFVWFLPHARAQTNCQYLLNLNFQSGTRTGMAATWNWIDDKWNIIPKAQTVTEYYNGSARF